MAILTVREYGGDYSTLNSALAAAAASDIIEISGYWTSDDTTCATIADDSITIRAVGEAKCPGYPSPSTGWYRLRTATADTQCILAYQKINLTVEGLEVRQNQQGTASKAAISFDRCAGTCTIEDCLAYATFDPTGHNSHGIYMACYNDVSPYNLNAYFTNCIAYGFLSFGIQANNYTGSAYTLNAYFNSCTVWDCGGGSGAQSGLGARKTGDASSLNAYIFNCVSVGNNGDDYEESGTYASEIVFDIHNCIDSDNSIASRGGNTDCLASRTPTDDDTPGTGDWVVFQDITTTPYDLRLKSSSENDAQDAHATSSAASCTMPGSDIAGPASRPQNTNYDIGAYEIPHILDVKQSGGSYSTLNSALAAAISNDYIEISGEWTQDDTTCATVADTGVVIRAVGSAKCKGYPSPSTGWYRLRVATDNDHAIDHSAYGPWIEGIEIRQNGNGNSTQHGIYSTTSLGKWYEVIDCLIYRTAAMTGGGTSVGINWLFTWSTNLVSHQACRNTIVYGFPNAGIRTEHNGTNGTSNIWVVGCTLWKNGPTGSVGSNEGGIVVVQNSTGSPAVNAYFLSTIVLDSNDAEDYEEDGGGAAEIVFDIHNCIDSDNSIASRGGNSNCLASRTATDDDTPGVGDWVVFQNITDSPYDLRLKHSSENDAQNGHSVGALNIAASSSTGWYSTMTSHDIADTVRPKRVSFDYGAFELNNQYTRGSYGSLPSDDSDLETAYSATDYTNVGSKNDTRVSQECEDGEYVLHQFKDYVVGHDSCTLEWEGQSDVAPSSSTVYLQIYDHGTDTWDTVDSDNSSGANTDFTLTGEVNVADYSDNGLITCRVYQQG